MKLNKKGITLIELIVSFAIVAVAIIYFFQTLYTVKTLYSKASGETNEYVMKDYGLRFADAYLESYEENQWDYFNKEGNRYLIVDYDLTDPSGKGATATCNTNETADSCCKRYGYKKNGIGVGVYVHTYKYNKLNDKIYAINAMVCASN